MKKHALAAIILAGTMTLSAVGLCACDNGTKPDDTSDCTVTFNYNDGVTADLVVDVTPGDSVAMPNEPQRADYTFMGWYTDNNVWDNIYDFSLPVTESLDLYAYWYSAPEGYSIAKFVMNDGTANTYLSVPFEDGAFWQDIVQEVKDLTPVWNGHYFTGWYKDSDCTETFNSLNSFSDDVSIYAGWKKSYTAEAEYTYIPDTKKGSGYSGSISGKGIIVGDTSDNRTASNGYYVSWLYYSGAYIDFEFDLDEDATDIQLAFSLSAQYDSISVTGDQIYIGIDPQFNGDEFIGYTQVINFPLEIESYPEMSSKLKDFQTYLLNKENISLSAGHHVIEFYINNNIKGTGATMQAAAPLIDCMYIYTNSDLTVTEYRDNI